MGLQLSDVVRSDDRIEDCFREAVEREAGFPVKAAGEDRQGVVAREAVEKALGGNPAFAKDETVRAVAMENFLEVVDNVGVGGVAPTLANHGVGEMPVVVEASAVLPFLNLAAGRLVPCEMRDGGLYGGAIGFGDVHKNAIHVEDDEVFVHQIRSSSATTRVACSRVPTVTRTPPGIS